MSAPNNRLNGGDGDYKPGLTEGYVFEEQILTSRNCNLIPRVRQQLEKSNVGLTNRCHLCDLCIAVMVLFLLGLGIHHPLPTVDEKSERRQAGISSS